MHRFAAAALLGLALAFTGCGDDKPADDGPTKTNTNTNESSSTNTSSTTAESTVEGPEVQPLAGAGWLGEPVDVAKADDKLYGIVFFKPG